MPTHITSHQLSHRFCSIKPYIIPQILHRSSHKNGREVMPIRAGGKCRNRTAPLAPKASVRPSHPILHIKYSLLTVLIVYHNHTVVSRNIVKNPIHLHHLLQLLLQAKLHHQRPYRYMGNHTHKQYMVLYYKNPLIVRHDTFP